MNIQIQQIIRDSVLNIANMLLTYQVEHVYIILEIAHLLMHQSYKMKVKKKEQYQLVLHLVILIFIYLIMDKVYVLIHVIMKMKVFITIKLLEMIQDVYKVVNKIEFPILMIKHNKQKVINVFQDVLNNILNIEMNV